MLDDILEKIRALIGDIGTDCPEVFTYDGNNPSFPLGACEVKCINSVLLNGTELGSGEYSFDSSTNTVTVTASMNEGDQIQVNYCALKYTDTELTEYVRASLVWLSIYSFCSEGDFELETDTIYPTPTNKENDLIALISSILIKPDYSSYRLPTLTITYPRTMPKEDRIEKLITKFKRGLGNISVLNWD